MLAKDIMTQQVIAVSPQTPVKQLAKTLSQNHISGTPVVDKSGKVVGVVTQRDLLGKKGAQVKSIMSKKVISVMEDTPVEEIASVMTARNVKRVPVFRGQKLAGIISRGDLVRAIATGEHIALRTPIYDL
jgi:CBS domain-containing protein